MTPDEAKKLYSSNIMNLETLRESVKQSLKHVDNATKSREPEAYARLSGWCNPEPGAYMVSTTTFTEQLTTYYGQMARAKFTPIPIEPELKEPSEEDIWPEPEPELGKSQYDSRHYSDYLFSNPKWIVEKYVDAVKLGTIPEHDTLISTGLSGSIAAGLFAHATDKMYAVLRKEGTKHHSGNDVEGRIGAKWIFVDDFIGGGHTRNRVHKRICELATQRDIKTTYVGSWLYVRSEYQEDKRKDS